MNEDATKFLVCEKAHGDITDQYIMPGGQMEEKDAMECLRREIEEELGCKVDTDKVVYIDEYSDVAAGDPDHEVVIDLYQGDLVGDPRPMSEIKHLHWIGKEDAGNPRVSAIIRNKIIPSLVEKNILH